VRQPKPRRQGAHSAAWKKARAQVARPRLAGDVRLRSRDTRDAYARMSAALALLKLGGAGGRAPRLDVTIVIENVIAIAGAPRLADVTGGRRAAPGQLAPDSATALDLPSVLVTNIGIITCQRDIVIVYPIVDRVIECAWVVAGTKRLFFRVANNVGAGVRYVLAHVSGEFHLGLLEIVDGLLPARFSVVLI